MTDRWMCGWRDTWMDNRWICIYDMMYDRYMIDINYKQTDTIVIYMNDINRWRDGIDG